jgi:DNA-nicking Smr family endonuclease
MPYPSLQDDGATVTLDLHGTTVDEATDLTLRVVREASRRGRTTIKVIHGDSTSSRLYQNKTIRHALHQMLDQGVFDTSVTGAWPAEAYILLSLAPTATADASPLRLADFTR